MRALLFLSLLSIALPLQAAPELPPLVEVSWLLQQPAAKDLVLLDIQPSAYYRQVHLTGALSAPFAVWRSVTPGGLQGMLPPLPRLADMLGRLGVSTTDRLVIVSTGLSAGDMAAAARVYWTLKVLGHRQVAILNGGLHAVAEDPQGGDWLGRETSERPATRYQARPDLTLLADVTATKTALSDGEVLVDARSSAEYLGIHISGEGERPGSLPGARNLPFDWLTENGSGRILPTRRVRDLLQAVGVAADAPQVHYCHSGNRAALTWFAVWAMLGNKQARLYDASMLEWAVRKDLPLERRVEF